MKLEKIISWLDQTLKVSSFDDVSNNGLQVDRSVALSTQPPALSTAHEVRTVAFAVDASVKAVEAAARAGAQLLIVHHGISWGGGIKRIAGGIGNVVRAAIRNNLAIAAYHLPLDAHPTLGNNACLAKLLGLRKVKPAFSYHGNVIGLVGKLSNCRIVELSNRAEKVHESGILGSLVQACIRRFDDSNDSTILTIGLCSGGAGEFAEEAQRLGCDFYLTGEASWGDVIAAENCGMKMLCLGHYATEVFGVRALARAMRRALKVKVVDLTETQKGEK